MKVPSALVLLGWLCSACVSHKVEIEPIEVKPIHLTVDINVKVQRELDDFYDFAEEGKPSKTEEDR